MTFLYQLAVLARMRGDSLEKLDVPSHVIKSEIEMCTATEEGSTASESTAASFMPST
jgi:hypothetical protein